MSPAPERVLMTADAVGGVWTYVAQLARGFAARGIDVVVACMGPAPSPGQRRELPAGVTLEVASFALEWMDGASGQIDDAGAWLLALERAYAPDIVHVNGYAHGALPTRAPRLVVAHSCVGSWFQAVHGTSMPERYAHYGQRLVAGCNAADAIVAPTAAMLSALKAAHGLTLDGRATVIPNGIALDARENVAKEPLVVAVGRAWDPAKNVDALCAIASELAWPVLVVGSTREARWTTRNVSNVRFTGHLERHAVRCVLSRASLFVHPARYEPFGLAALEAAAAGCALVLGDIPSLREVWGDAAVYAAPDDRRALQAIIGALIRDPQWRTEVADRCRLRAEHYPLHTMTEAYVALYSRLLAGHHQEPTCASSSSLTRSSRTGTTATPTSCAESSPSSSGEDTTSAATNRATPGAPKTSSAIMV